MFIVDIYLFFFDAHKYFVKIIKYIRSIKYILFVFTVNNIDIYVRKYLNSYIKHIHIQMIIFNLIIYIFLYPYLLISFLQRGFTDYPSRPKYLAPRNALRLDSIYFDEPLWKPFDDTRSFRRNFVDGTFERSVRAMRINYFFRDYI